MDKTRLILFIVVIFLLASISTSVLSIKYQGKCVFPKQNVKIVRHNSNNHGYLVIKNYNDSGGFFWHIHNIATAGHVAAMYNMQLIIRMESGYYLEKNERFKKKYANYVTVNGTDNNWFNYYFQPLMEDIVIPGNSLIPFGKVMPFKFIKSDKFYEFTRGTFSSIDGNVVDYHRAWNELMIPRSYVKEIVADFIDKKLRDSLTVSIHWRGTDKFGIGKGLDNEDDPIHYEYNWMLSALQDKVSTLLKEKMLETEEQSGKLNVKIFVCSDEQPFIEFMEKNCIYPVVYTNSLRSDVTTGGLHLKTTGCNLPENKENEHCKKLKYLEENSVHRGMIDKSSFMKGLDVLIDVMIVSQTNLFLKSSGNVSNWPSRINPNLSVIHMNDLYRKN